MPAQATLRQTRSRSDVSSCSRLLKRGSPDSPDSNESLRRQDDSNLHASRPATLDMIWTNKTYINRENQWSQDWRHICTFALMFRLTWMPFPRRLSGCVVSTSPGRITSHIP